MRFSLIGSLIGWFTFALVNLFWPLTLPVILTVIVASCFTLLWILHLTVLTKREITLQRILSYQDNALSRRQMLESGIKGLAGAILLSIPLVKNVAAQSDKVRYGVRTENGEPWAYIGLADGQELIAAIFDPKTGLEAPRLTDPSNPQKSDVYGLRVFGLTARAIDALSESDVERYYRLFQTAEILEAAFLWRTGLPSFRGSQEEKNVLERLARHLYVFLSKLIKAIIDEICRKRANGCGGNDLLGALVPNLWFKDCCDAHDICYCKGGTETDRSNCDGAFFSCMSGKCESMGLLKNWCMGMASIYYRAVRKFGKKYFGSGG
jgi:hypothetical protein